MRERISYNDIVKLLSIDGEDLRWICPTKGRRKNGAIAGGINKNNGALIIEISGTPYKSGHLAWLMEYKEHPKYKIEHINGNKQDNRIENLKEIIPCSTVLTQDLVRMLFDYDNGVLRWIEKLSARSQYVIGSAAGFVSTQKDSEYRYIKIGGKRYNAANIIWLYHYGVMPDVLIDHINHDKSDNRIENLRLATQKENSRNRSLGVKNTSGVIGVDKHEGKWSARIINNEGKRISLGRFKTFKEAAAARAVAELALGYHPNHGK